MCRLDKSDLTRAAYTFGTSADPTNPQLLFYHFLAIWEAKSRFEPEAAALIAKVPRGSARAW
jgi:hypothetical protein